MCSKPFEVQIGCIIPTNYDTVVGGANNDKPLKWKVERRCQFRHGVDQQMELLRQDWDKSSGSRISIRWKCRWYTEVVRQMRRHGRRHEIDDPAFKLFRKRFTSEGAMYQFVWIVFPPSIRNQVPDQSHYCCRVGWLPCWESCEPAELLRSGVHDESRHCLNNALVRAKVCKSKTLKLHPKRKFMRMVLPLLTPEALEKLSKCFAGYPRWNE